MTESSSSSSRRIKSAVKPALPVEVRRSESSTRTVPATVTPTAKSSSKHSKQQVHVEAESSLALLSDSDKKKVAKLVDKLLQLGAEHDALQQRLEQERGEHEQSLTHLAASMEGQLSIIEDQLRFKDESIASMQAQEALLISLLALYQGKLKNMHEFFQLACVSSGQQAEKLKDLSGQCEQLHEVVDNQRRVVEGLERTLSERDGLSRRDCALLEREVADLQVG
ncbi:hypothetical protein EON64_13335 [archaeon]|nr:MAG: hypothetical protein EON64_13335 [archaeon]